MYQRISEYDFQDAFHSIRPDNFSDEGLRLLFDWFTELEDGTGEQIELDVIAICCDYCESTVKEIIDDYFDFLCSDKVFGNYETYEEIQEVVANYLNARTTVIGTTKGGNAFVYEAF
jgi:hypothetical protein